jgi:hypothetical protein
MDFLLLLVRLKIPFLAYTITRWMKGHVAHFIAFVA